MKIRKYDDSLTLQPRTNREDRWVAEMIASIGISEVSRRSKLSQSTVSRWSGGQIALARSSVDRIMAVVKEEDK